MKVHHKILIKKLFGDDNIKEYEALLSGNNQVNQCWRMIFKEMYNEEVKTLIHADNVEGCRGRIKMLAELLDISGDVV